MQDAPLEPPSGFRADPGWTLVLISFFGVIIAANVALIVIASSGTPSQLVAENSYEAGLRYDETLEAARRTRALGWSWSLTDCEAGPCVHLVGEDGAPLAGAGVHASLMRPSDETLDRKVVLAEAGPGRFLLPDGLTPGLWDLSLTVTRDEDTGHWRRAVMLAK